MGIPILSVRDDQGNIIPIPAIQGRDGVDGKDGKDGKDGAAGPNLINQNTLTPMAGILMGSGGSVKTAVSGTDYATPAEPPRWMQTTTPAPSTRPPRPVQPEVLL